VALLTFGFFAAHSVTSSWVGQRAGDRKAQASSLYLSLYYLGASITGAVAGIFWERYGWTGVGAFLMTLIVGSLTLAVPLRRAEVR
jgi:YNFM family putative membrane transporter